MSNRCVQHTVLWKRRRKCYLSWLWLSSARCLSPSWLSPPTVGSSLSVSVVWQAGCGGMEGKERRGSTASTVCLPEHCACATVWQPGGHDTSRRNILIKGTRRFIRQLHINDKDPHVYHMHAQYVSFTHQNYLVSFMNAIKNRNASCLAYYLSALAFWSGR